MAEEISSQPSQADALHMRASDATRFLKLMANQDRLMVLCALSEGEMSVRGLEDRLGIRQPGLSQQLAGLRAAGLISGRKEGKHIFYHLADPRAAEVISTLYRVFCAPDMGAKG